jgi:flagellum-specific peptidoglycan hydrolase FlgJ
MSIIRILLITAFIIFGKFCHAQKVVTNYINKFSPISKKLCVEYGIPASIILGVSILESGSGTSKNCKDLNNYFGMTGKNSLKKRRSMYKQYATAEDSFHDFCKMLSRKKFYPSMKDNMNYKKWLTAMNNAHYAGAKGVWISRVTSIIVKHKLNVYDEK